MNVVAKTVTAIIVAVLALTIIAAAVWYHFFSVNETSSEFSALRVAHAAGSVDGNAYTNSYQALNHNLQQGFRYFELDLMFTSDRQLVCLHDWRDSFAKNFGFDPRGALSLSDFERALVSSKYTNCTLDGLADWLSRNPDTVIITDVKGEGNIEALEQITSLIPNAHTRVIPQVYQPENMTAVRDIGYEKVIWTLYRFKGDNESVVDWAGRLRRSNFEFAVTMPKRLAITSLPNDLKSIGVASYVHTVNDQREAAAFLNNGITEIYTDVLFPEKL